VKNHTNLVIILVKTSVQRNFNKKNCIFVPYHVNIKRKKMEQVQYITDNKGNKMAAVVPFQEWESLTEQYRKLQTKINVLLGIQDGLKEIRQAKRKGEKLQTLDNFLYECGY
jgi:hypothetical protein